MSGASLKGKGHQREPSEASSGGSDENQAHLEIDRLTKKLVEISEVLEARETKLIELSRRNAELQEANCNLKSDLEAAREAQANESRGVSEVTEEFTQRLAALERRLQQAMREKESFKTQLEAARQEAACRLSVSELQATLAEKDEEIKELREEGEKLSRQQLQHSNIIKKLRAKEKETETAMKNQKEKIEEQTREIERLKRSLAAREEMERSQIEAVRQLTVTKQKQEKELAALLNEHEEANELISKLQTTLAATEEELSEACRLNAECDQEAKEKALSAEVATRQALQAELEEERREASRQRDQLINQVSELREALTRAEQENARQQEAHRIEISSLLARLEASTSRSEELSENISVATRPLLRQIESLQAAAQQQQASWDRQEKALQDRLMGAQSQQAVLVERERAIAERNTSLNSQSSELESRLNSLQKELSSVTAELENEKTKNLELAEAKSKESALVESLKRSLTEEVSDLRREIGVLEHQLEIERAAIAAEKRKNHILQEQLKDRDRRGGSVSPRSSPTLSVGHVSIAESFSSAVWPQYQDDLLETASMTGARYGVYDSLRGGSSSSLLEGLQSQLKQREGEIQQLQWELTRREQERSGLFGELATLTARVDDAEERVAEMNRLKERFTDMDTKYNALLSMYGEKLEENEELKLDLQDVKEMYKSQIDQLLKRDSTPSD